MLAEAYEHVWDETEDVLVSFRSTSALADVYPCAKCMTDICCLKNATGPNKTSFVEKYKSKPQ